MRPNSFMAIAKPVASGTQVYAGSVPLENISGAIAVFYADVSVTKNMDDPPDVVSITDVQDAAAYSNVATYQVNPDQSIYGNSVMTRSIGNATLADHVKLGQTHTHKASYFFRGGKTNYLGIFSSDFSGRSYLQVTATQIRWVSGNSSSGYLTAAISHGVDTAEVHDYYVWFSQSIFNYLRAHCYVDGVSIGTADRTYLAQAGVDAATQIQVQGSGSDANMMSWCVFNRALSDLEIANMSG